MDAQTGTAKTCQCCRSKPSYYKVHLVTKTYPYHVYEYLCTTCANLVEAVSQAERVEIVPYIGVVSDDDPLEEVRKVYDEITFANWRKDSE